MLQIVGELESGGDFRVSGHGPHQLSSVEVHDAQVLVRAAGGHKRTGRVQMELDQHSIVALATLVTLLLFSGVNIINSEKTYI